MVIRGRAPLRVSFGGGGTDVEPFCVEQGGAIIGSTINKYAYCSIIPRDDDQITVHSLDFDMTVKYNAKENYVCDGRLDLVTAALRAMDIKQGCEVYLQCDAPAGSGLGTSSTVMVSLLTAMARWKGITLDNYAMADLAYGVERIDLGISGGYQDQYAATFGGFNFIEFHGRNNVVVNPLRIRRDIINELQYNLLLCYMPWSPAPMSILPSARPSSALPTPMAMSGDCWFSSSITRQVAASKPQAPSR